MWAFETELEAEGHCPFLEQNYGFHRSSAVSKSQVSSFCSKSIAHKKGHQKTQHFIQTLCFQWRALSDLLLSKDNSLCMKHKATFMVMPPQLHSQRFLSKHAWRVPAISGISVKTVSFNKPCSFLFRAFLKCAETRIAFPARGPVSFDFPLSITETIKQIH